MDAAIFDDALWVTHYNDYWKDTSAGGRQTSDLQWLNDHLLAVVEFKRDDKEIEQVFTRQVKPAMREKDPSDAYVLLTTWPADGPAEGTCPCLVVLPNYHTTNIRRLPTARLFGVEFHQWNPSFCPLEASAINPSSDITEASPFYCSHMPDIMGALVPAFC